LNGKEVNITAVYSGSNKYDKATETITTTVTKTTPTLTTSDITASAGETITLTAHVTDNDKVINNGKVVFKVNGKTVKDASGKVIYAKVVKNQVSVNYTIPVDMKAKEYNLTATFISSDYDRLEDTKTLTVTG
ncbi:MAG: Ig-like domain repeat protein, partial [Methanosphaera sp.]|nr:Ig-like domain repeat protein [Methanosphaera sp.]